MSPLTDVQLGALLTSQRHVAVIVTTLEGRVVSWNRGAEALFGYRRAEALGGSIAELIVPPEGLEEHRAAWQRAADDGSVIFAADRRAQDGRRVPVVASLDVSGTNHGDARYVIATLRDRGLVAPPLALVREDVGEERDAAAPGTVALPQRQRQVLSRIADGLTTREIAQRLGLSPKTVETHRSRLMRRLRARNLAELLRRALELGIVQIGPQRAGGRQQAARRS